MSEALVWMEETYNRLQEMDYLGITPDPQPELTSEELLSTIQEFWAQGYSVGQTYAWALAAEQEVSPFEIKRQFYNLDLALARSQRDLG